MPHRKNIADFYALLTGAVVDTIHFSLRLWLIRNTTCLIKEPIDGSSAHIQVIAHALRRSDNEVDFVVDSHALVQKCRLPEVAALVRCSSNGASVLFQPRTECCPPAPGAADCQDRVK
jgi:hypothetical protein